MKSLAPRLSESDAAEIDAVCGLGPADGLMLAHAHADESWAAEHRGDVVAVWGVVETGRESACVWMLADWALAREVGAPFLRELTSRLKGLRERWPFLHAYGDERNIKQAAWFRRLGFQAVGTIKDHGAAKLPFHEYVLITAE